MKILRLLILSVIATSLLVFLSCKKDSEPYYSESESKPIIQTVSDYRAIYSAADTSITLKWKNPNNDKFVGNELTIVSYSEKKRVILGALDSSFVVRDSIWGGKYLFSMKSLYSDSINSSIVEISKRLLDESEIPDIPLLYILTENQELPTCDYVSSPPGATSRGITNNSYVNGRMEILQNGSVVYDSGEYSEGSSGMRIRIRGNTSAYTRKKPYKIHLEKKENLFPEYGDTSADKEYVLLKDFESRTFVGNAVSAAVGLEWQPKCKYVNVVINGKWNGLYILSESVKKGETRVNIENSGLILENDAYWWNNSTYFKSDHVRLGYTFKYPNDDVLNDSYILPVKNYINEFESYLFSGNDSCFEYIDVKSFAKWLLCQDLLGNGDPCGSNMYMYSRRFFYVTGDVKENKRLYMGPCWDFDVIYNTSDSWAYIRLHEYVFYYTELVKMKIFKETYVKEYDNVKHNISFAVSNMFEKMIQQKGDAINRSMILDKERWGGKNPTIEENRDVASKWFSSRIEWMENQVNQGMR